MTSIETQQIDNKKRLTRFTVISKTILIIMFTLLVVNICLFGYGFYYSQMGTALRVEAQKKYSFEVHNGQYMSAISKPVEHDHYYNWNLNGNYYLNRKHLLGEFRDGSTDLIVYQMNERNDFSKLTYNNSSYEFEKIQNAALSSAIVDYDPFTENPPTIKIKNKDYVWSIETIEDQSFLRVFRPEKEYFDWEIKLADYPIGKAAPGYYRFPEHDKEFWVFSDLNKMQTIVLDFLTGETYTIDQHSSIFSIYYDKKLSEFILLMVDNQRSILRYNLEGELVDKIEIKVPKFETSDLSIKVNEYHQYRYNVYESVAQNYDHQIEDIEIITYDEMDLLFVTVNPQIDNPRVGNAFHYDMQGELVVFDKENQQRLINLVLAREKGILLPDGNYLLSISSYIMLISPEGELLEEFAYLLARNMSAPYYSQNKDRVFIFSNVDYGGGFTMLEIELK